MQWTIGILGLTHDHVWTHIGELRERGDSRIVIAEPNQSLLDKARDEYAIHDIFPDYAEMLEQATPDAVLIFTDNTGTASLVELAASHGMPIMTEKPMADSLVNAERMLHAAERAGVPLMVNWPTWWNPSIRHLVTLAQNGEVGEIVRFSFRGGHGGPRELGCSDEFCDWLFDPERNGGGAYIDYCGYGASLARLLLGLPSHAHAFIDRLVKTTIPVDDNAVLTLLYPTAFAVIEATWTAAGPIPGAGPTVAGTHGSLVVNGPTDAYPRALRHTSPRNPDGRVIEPPTLPYGDRNATEYFLACLRDNRTIDGQVSAVISRDAQEILEAGLRSSRSATTVSLPISM